MKVNQDGFIEIDFCVALGNTLYMSYLLRGFESGASKQLPQNHRLSGFSFISPKLCCFCAPAVSESVKTTNPPSLVEMTALPIPE